MTFNDLRFPFFFSLVAICYYAFPGRIRWLVLLGASYWFYAISKPLYALLLVLPTVVDYCVARNMERQESQRWRKALLSISLAVDLGVLFLFKYYGFFRAATEGLVGVLPEFGWALPVGISFFTFQSLGYVIDVYRRDQAAEHNFVRYALFVSFFPQVTAGPIGRAATMLPQHRSSHAFLPDNVTGGLQLMLWGFFKKLVIADRLAIYVNQVYDHPTVHHGWSVVLATYFFAFQIYCDFSGYTDIARGCGQVLGYNLPENFRQPYFAESIRDFWRRWHISLTTWLRDYLFFGLGISRTSRLRNYLNVVIVYVVCGLWHGARWTFVLWGGYHGILCVASLVSANFRKRLTGILGVTRVPVIHRAVRSLIAFHLVIAGWVIFRVDSVTDLATVWRNMWQFGDTEMIFNGGLDIEQIWIGVAGIALLVAIEAFQARGPVREWIAAKPLPLRWALYYTTLFATFLLAADSDLVKFIYFQF